jgi:ATPase subunit of ABC transporter with duplicated ATPase domains
VFVQLIDLTFSYADAVPIIEDASIQLAPGWSGIVGQNGAGKSTLLHLIAGDLEPTSGHVRLDPPGLSIEYCVQTVESLTPAIERFAAATDGVARRIHGELALDPAALARWPTLSPGERKRWQVGAALAAEPGVLMLDEPTDHLDVEARALLLEGLARFRGIGLVVSHDRTLLDALTSYTIRVHDGSARIWRGSYADAKAAWEAEERERHASHERIKQRHAVLKRRLADKRRLAQSAEAAWNAGAGRRMRGPRDHDATSMAARGKAEMASRRISRDAGVLRAAVERTADELGEFKFRKEKGRALFVDFEPAPVAKLMTLDVAAICAGDRALLRDVHVAVTRDARVRVAGPNGIGKSTLLDALLRGAHVPRPRLLYLPQELSAGDGAALLDDVRALGGADRARVLTLVAALGVDPDRLLQSQLPSPGEARKLKLAWGLGTQVWAAVLDEPTNHLDMPAIERLEDALAEYPGALVIVTHDEPLARRCTREEWHLADGRIDVRSVSLPSS